MYIYYDCIYMHTNVPILMHLTDAHLRTEQRTFAMHCNVPKCILNAFKFLTQAITLKCNRLSQELKHAYKFTQLSCHDPIVVYIENKTFKFKRLTTFPISKQILFTDLSVTIEEITRNNSPRKKTKNFVDKIIKNLTNSKKLIWDDSNIYQAHPN